jgi:hypothetical protein
MALYSYAVIDFLVSENTDSIAVDSLPDYHVPVQLCCRIFRIAVGAIYKTLTA